MSKSKTIQLGKYESRISSDTNYLDITNEIDRKMSQACGVISMLCITDIGGHMSDVDDNAIAQVGWGLLETMAEIKTLTGMLSKLAYKQEPAA